MAEPPRATFHIPGERAEPEDAEDDSLHDLGRLTHRLGLGRRPAGSAEAAPVLGVAGEALFRGSPRAQPAGMLTIHRPVYSQSDFQRCFEENRQRDLHRRFLDNVFLPASSAGGAQGRQAWPQLLAGLFPFLGVLRAYRWRHDLLLDLVSGLTTGAMRIPQAMAYAFLARLTPAMGLYTAFFSALLYVVFGASSHTVTGAQGVLSLMLGAGIERHLDVHANRSALNASELAAEAARVALPITMAAGGIQMGLGVARLGFVTNYLSDPLVGGFTTGAACQVVASQLKDVFGVAQAAATGWFKAPMTLYRLCVHARSTNPATLTIAGSTILLLLLVKTANRRFRLRVPLPGELFVMAGAIAFSLLTDAAARWQVRVVGRVPAGFQRPAVPDVALVPRVLDVAFTTAIVSFAIGYSIAKQLALRHDYELSGSQEVFAFGFMNFTGAFFHAFVATGTMSVSALHDSLGGVSQVANIVASGLVLLVILFLGFLFEPAPDCVLSAIILVNLKGILGQFSDLPVLWRVSKIDFLSWLVTWAAVVVLDVDIGLLLGVTFSLLTVVFRTQWPYVCELGRIPSTDLYKNRSITPEAMAVPGVRIIRFEGSLYFASAEHFRRSLYAAADCSPHKILHQRCQLEAKICALRTTLRRIGSQQGAREPSTAGEEAEDEEAAPLLPHRRKEVHHIIVDFSTCSFVDSVGLRTLNQCIIEYKEAGVSVYLANVRAAVRAILFNEAARSGASPRKTFLSVHDAVLAALEAAQRREEREFHEMDALSSSYYRHDVSRTSVEVTGSGGR